jgi:radical SAM superfamily enzyme YgiQ (UPF0313 family)/glycosyltransferase involved in cell wall biosynthesis/predicted O-methyltransferase YrrM
MEFIPARCIRFDDSLADKGCLVALGSFIGKCPGAWGLYGDSQFIDALLTACPTLLSDVAILENLGCDRNNSVPDNIFICSTSAERTHRYHKNLSSFVPDERIYTVAILENIAPHSIPEDAYQPEINKGIYPVLIPELSLHEELDFLLLDLPASYSLLRVGFGYVHELLKGLGVRHQTVDLNSIIYHRFHMSRLLDRSENKVSETGYVIPEDPWSPFAIDEWEKQELVEYFSDEIATFLAEVKRVQPKMVGISLQLGNRLMAKMVVKGIRQVAPATAVIVGGFDCVHKEFGPRIFPDFDYMVIGEAELTLPALVRELLTGGRPANLPGVVSYGDAEDMAWQPGALCEDLDSLPFPKYDWQDFSLYRAWYGGYTAELAINRGCKWSRCTFCNECFTWRKRSAINVVTEIQWFVDQGCRNFNFSVSDAIGDSVTLYEIAEEIIRRGLDININTQLRIDKRSDYNYFRVLNKAGFKTLAFGVDGWTDKILKLQNKGYNFKLVKQNIEDAHRAGIKVSVNIVVGVPGESDSDIVEVINNIVSLKESIDSFNSIYHLLLAPGSKYYMSPDTYNIKFIGEQADIYTKYPYRIPGNLWFSEEPYIDETVRLTRMVFVCDQLVKSGITVENHVIYMVSKLVSEAEGLHMKKDHGTESPEPKQAEEQATLCIAKPAPVLSLLCQGRNDSYMGNFTWRLSTVLNKLAENIVMLGFEEQVEILVADWGSEEPLYTALELMEPARRLVKFLLVPPAVAAVYDRDAGFSVPHAINAIARRARGKYVMFSDSDVFLPMETMAKLMYYLKAGYFHSFDLRNSFFWASKYHIPNDFIADSPYREHVEEHIAGNWSEYVHETVNTLDFQGSGVCLLMSRAMWFESTGWDEKLIYMGWNDIDFTRRLMFKYRWDDLENHGMTFFHLEHYKDRFNPNYAAENKKRLNPYAEPTTISPNPSNWGLADHVLGFVDGFGLPIDAADGVSHATSYVRFDQQRGLQTVQEIIATNPLYKTLAQRFPFEPHSWFSNEQALTAILEALQPRMVCEIGSWMGASARCFANAPSVKRVACVDHWDRSRVEKYKPGIHPEHLMNNMYEQFMANAVHSGTDQKICPVRLESEAAADYCEKANLRFDLIYVDGDHTSVGARADILKWAPLLSNGGYLCGDDWAWQTEPDNVAGAVVSAAQQMGWQVYHHGNFWLVVPGTFTVEPLSWDVINSIQPIANQEVSEKASELDSLIAPEIRDDEFYNLIMALVESCDGTSGILEIGSSAGGGSTEAFVSALERRSGKMPLYCMEVSQPRFRELSNRYADRPYVKCYNTSSVSLARFASAAEVQNFYGSNRTNLNLYPLPQVLGWLDQDREYISKSGCDEDGIRRIRRENNIDRFDIVLIDGSEFTGKPELDDVYGATWILLDDINIFKNFENYQRLRNDPQYELYQENWQLRNGYAVFRKKSSSLPVHFFTIVLNGMPYVTHHIEVLQRLPFEWHWHIVEGVAEHRHDTAWSLPLGGAITAALHTDGLSNDGTTQYLDELKARLPKNITVYRKPGGLFWDGKLEMVRAPLAQITGECLLWQLDVDELWTSEQFSIARNLFLGHPDKTAAFYWSWFFVGPDRVVSTRNCYSQNPGQEWLRTWRYRPGMQWAAHEPPRLMTCVNGSEWQDVAALNPLMHAETEAEGLVFQHFAYALAQQIAFKECYYGYKGAVARWQELQNAALPTLLSNYFPWVTDETAVDASAKFGIKPLIELTGGSLSGKSRKQLIVVDGIFFQFRNTGIARVWYNMLLEWSKTEFAESILLLDRVGTAPKIPGIRTRVISAYDYDTAAEDRVMLQTVCDEEHAVLFVSTYYTMPLTTPAVFYAYDMIPENTVFFDLAHPLWQMKHHGIRNAKEYVAISRNTAYDVVRFYPEAAGKITVAYCAVDTERFYHSPEEEIEKFRSTYGVYSPYLVFIGDRLGYKNAELLFQALRTMDDVAQYEIVCVGGNETLEEYLADIAPRARVRILPIADDMLRAAYSGAVALTYPSVYEGFGLPILEAMACGCPVITCQNSSIPEVAGSAALYVGEFRPDELATAIHRVQEPEVRASLVSMGYRQCKKFAWSKMAATVQDVLIANCRDAGRTKERG